MGTVHNLEKNVFVLKFAKIRSTFSEHVTYLSCNIASAHTLVWWKIWKMYKLRNADVVLCCSCEIAGNRAILIGVVVEIILMLNQ